MPDSRPAVPDLPNTFRSVPPSFVRSEGMAPPSLILECSIHTHVRQPKKFLFPVTILTHFSFIVERNHKLCKGREYRKEVSAEEETSQEASTEDTSGDTTEDTSGDASGDTTEDTANDAADDTSEDTSEGTADDTSDSQENTGELSTDTSLTVADGDTVNIDYVGTVDGVEFDGGSTNGTGTDLVIGSGSYIDDFEDQLIGAHPGDEVRVEVTFPDDYGSQDLAGKDAVFAVTINGIYQ